MQWSFATPATDPLRYTRTLLCGQSTGVRSGLRLGDDRAAISVGVVRPNQISDSLLHGPDHTLRQRSYSGSSATRVPGAQAGARVRAVLYS